MCGLHLNPNKCILYAFELHWCGRLIIPQGWSFDPRNVRALIYMETPTTGSYSHKLIWAMQCMRTALTKFAKLIAPLQDLMGTIYDIAGKWTKRAVERILLSKFA